ncbi:MAG: Dipeptide transport system permease protein DppC [Candidatus Celerinatantimonas neptuna]|nr:MAG: Dipeptide transport system permease protein DppC [Candidatus Celerinatantimonas neptuna]
MSEQTTSQSAPKPLTPFQEFWLYFRQNKGAVAGLLYIIVIIVFALFAEVIAPHSPIQQFQNSFLQPPAWQSGGSWKFILGTDDVGRDIFSRLIYGARLSLIIGTMVVTLSLSVGVLLGLIAGYSRGMIDTVIMRIADIMLAVPSLLFAIAIVAILGPSLFKAAIAIAIVSVPHFIRLTRASVIAETTRDYVTSSRVVGAGAFRLMFITILPNCLAPLIIQATLGFSSALLDMAALGFLGMGAQPPTPEWGSMLANARQYVTRAWWVVTFPGLMILMTVLAFNLMGDGLRDALDPKMKR